MNIKILITAILQPICMHAWSQSTTDTIQLESVPVFALTTYNDGAKKESFDSATLKAFPYSNIGELLSYASNIIIKNYGTEGMSGSVSLRGGGSSRTQINWEGIPINTLTSGEHNISLIPVSSFNTIEIDHSASATVFGNGTFGGVIGIRTIPTWKKQTSTSFSLSYGSFSTLKMQGGVTLSNEHIHYSSTFFYTKSQSDFPYYDYVQKENLYRKNADYKKNGTIQNIHIRANDHLFFQGSLWYLVNDTNLPSIIGSTTNREERQIDSTFRILGGIKIIYPSWSLTYKLAHIYDYELYTKKLQSFSTNYSTYSEIISRTNLHITNGRYTITDDLSANIEIQGKMANANVDDYKEEKHEKSFAAIAGIRYQFNTVTTCISFRKEYNSHYKIPLIINGGIEYKPLHYVKVRGNIGNKYRTPTFNDLYWFEWGNPNLKPESGLSTELGTEITILNKDSLHLTVDVTAYHSIIDDMIMWRPQGAVWHPYNTAQAVLQGIECSLSNTYTTNAIQIQSKIGYNLSNPHITKTYTDEESDECIGHILYYVPRTTIHFSNNMERKSWLLSVVFNYESKRYYTITKALDAYYTIDLAIKKSFTIKTPAIIRNFKGCVITQIRNITDVRYEQIRSYPLPGRYYEISLQCFIN